MDATTGKVALRILRNLKAREAEYRAEREEWYRAGDGRSPKWYQGPDDDRPYNYGGKGYSFPSACVHGSSAWTDYDNICGPCEDGYSIYQLAVWEATSRVAEMNKRIDWLVDAPDSLRRTEIHRELLTWALSPIK
ncbi:hypothetical protein SEA_FAUST_260 [Streptomyces phage Faust]|uniref:Uncharacterized protein n=1 Tax=Streptomyces phage Faust TaxID=2767565 RepID=A0A7G9UZ77_9CAUD|nr:hypothetical protein PP456_gp027 [Streptomyces phage Faust]QNN99332.1 hypothetical protein SEA_FAUST_260 [Streptomyces phage Faust]